MALKDLLVCVGNDPACAERIDVAVCIAAAHEAHLTGLCVMAWPPIPSYAETQFPQEVREWQAGQLREACREAKQLFRGRAGGAGDVGADLLVMGAYGHARLREMVLGGATRHILQHMTVPVLMSH